MVRCREGRRNEEIGQEEKNAKRALRLRTSTTQAPVLNNLGSPAFKGGALGSFLYSSSSNDTNSMEGGEIYRLELDGTVLGKFGRARKLPQEFGTVNEIDCRNPNELVVGEITNWRVLRLRLKL